MLPHSIGQRRPIIQKASWLGLQLGGEVGSGFAIGWENSRGPGLGLRWVQGWDLGFQDCGLGYRALS